MSSANASKSWHGFETASLPEVPSWVETLGRFGHIAKGVVYFIIGFLAFKLAIGAGGEISGSEEALREIGAQPFGRVLLGLTAIGLLGYAAWRWVQAVKDTEGKGNDLKGFAIRSGYAISGVIHLFLGGFAGLLALGLGGSSDSSSGSRTAFLLASTWGRVSLGIVGATVVGVGIYFMVRGYQARFMTKYKLGEMSETVRTIALHAGRTGLITRGIAVVIIGGFLFGSAWSGTSSGEVTGIEDALAVIAAQPFGKVLLGLTGFGLMAYAVHMVLYGRFRHFNVAGR